MKLVSDHVETSTGMKPIIVSAKDRIGIEQIFSELIRICLRITIQKPNRRIVRDGDTVMLVMPQNIQRLGRLILPQVQTIRNFWIKMYCIMCYRGKAG